MGKPAEDPEVPPNQGVSQFSGGEMRAVMSAVSLLPASASASAATQHAAAATGKPLTDDELRVIAAYPDELSLLYAGLLA